MSRFTEKELLALRAVCYGCNTNKRLVGGCFVENFREPSKTKEITFSKALEIVYKIIEEG